MKANNIDQIVKDALLSRPIQPADNSKERVWNNIIFERKKVVPWQWIAAAIAVGMLSLLSVGLILKLEKNETELAELKSKINSVHEKEEIMQPVLEHPIMAAEVPADEQKALQAIAVPLAVQPSEEMAVSVPAQTQIEKEVQEIPESVSIVEPNVLLVQWVSPEDQGVDVAAISHADEGQVAMLSPNLSKPKTKIRLFGAKEQHEQTNQEFLSIKIKL